MQQKLGRPDETLQWQLSSIAKKIFVQLCKEPLIS